MVVTKKKKKQSGGQNKKKESNCNLRPSQLEYLKAVEEWRKERIQRGSSSNNNNGDNLYWLLKDVVNDETKDDSYFSSYYSNSSSPEEQRQSLDKLVHEVILKELDSLYEEYSFAIAKDASLTDDLRYASCDEYSEDSLVYGEIDLLGFGRLLQEVLQLPQPQSKSKSQSGQGSGNGGIFYDLGSGSGRAVFAARYHGDFTTCVGIELLENLHLLATSVQSLYKFQHYRDKLQYQEIEFICSDLLLAENWWHNGTIVYVPNLLFDNHLMNQIAKKAIQLQGGAYLISLKKFFAAANTTTTGATATAAAKEEEEEKETTIAGSSSSTVLAAEEEEKEEEEVEALLLLSKEFHNAFELILQRNVPMSWGESNVYVYRRQ